VDTAKENLPLTGPPLLGGGVFVGFGEMDPVMNGTARLLSFHRSRLQRQQLRIAQLMRSGLKQTEAAIKLRISPQAISKQVKSMGWIPYSEAEFGWRTFIEKWVNPTLEKPLAIKSISDQFLLFSGLLVLWSFVSYGMSADPLPDGGTFDWKMWRRVLVLRIIVAAGISYLIGHSIVVSGWLATFAAAQPWIRFRSRQQWTAELEVLITAVNLGFIFLLIRHLHLRLHTYIEVQVS
jgi:hypothetical protein